MEINLKEASIEKLKAMAYDQISTAEQCRANIQIIQNELNQRRSACEQPKPDSSSGD